MLAMFFKKFFKKEIHYYRAKNESRAFDKNGDGLA